MSKFYDIILYDPYTDIPLAGLMDTNIYNHKICNEWIDKIPDNLIIAENEEMIVYRLKKTYPILCITGLAIHIETQSWTL